MGRQNWNSKDDHFWVMLFILPYIITNVQILLSPHPNGTESLDISADGRFIVTLSKEVNYYLKFVFKYIFK